MKIETFFKNLPAESRLIFLQWMRDGLVAQVKRNLEANALREFHLALRGQTFDIERIWSRVPIRSREHLEHVAPYLAQIQDALAEAAESLTPKKSALPADPELAPTVDQKKKTPASKSRTKRKSKPKKGCRG